MAIQRLSRVKRLFGYDKAIVSKLPSDIAEIPI